MVNQIIVNFVCRHCKWKLNAEIENPINNAEECTLAECNWNDIMDFWAVDPFFYDDKLNSDCKFDF